MAGLQTDAGVIAAASEVQKHDADYPSEKSGHESESVHELDGIHDGLVFPTDEERATLRRVSDDIPWNAYRAYFYYRLVFFVDVFPGSDCHGRSGGAILGASAIVPYSAKH
jgi:hypothetical protein